MIKYKATQIKDPFGHKIPENIAVKENIEIKEINGAFTYEIFINGVSYAKAKSLKNAEIFAKHHFNMIFKLEKLEG